MKAKIAKRMPKNKASNIEGAKNKRPKREEEKVVILPNKRKPSPCIKLFTRGKENQIKNQDNNSLSTPQMKYKETQGPKTPKEDPLIWRGHYRGKVGEEGAPD